MLRTYQISGMHCNSCVGKVTTALQGVAGIISAQVALNPPEARVEMARLLPIDELNKAVGVAGDYRIAESGGDQFVPPTTNAQESLFPLFLIIAYITGATALLAIATGDKSPESWMRHFMGGFFLVFSFFKLLDLRGFATAYQSYDLVAKAVPFWGWIYPFIELALGAAYVLELFPLASNLLTLVLMLVGAAGVLMSLLNKRAIRCACLGTALNLPMTTITLVEDLGMAAMAVLMLIMN